MNDLSAVAERIEKESAFLRAVVQQVEGVIVGQKALIEGLLVGLLADGHISAPSASEASGTRGACHPR